MAPTRSELDDLHERFRTLQQPPDMCPCGAVIDDTGLCPECGHDWREIIGYANDPPNDFVPDQGG